MKRMTLPEKIGKIFIYTVLALSIFVFLVPFWIVTVTSVVSETERISRGLLILYPRRIDFSAYQILLTKNSQLVNAYGITVFRTVAGTICNLIVTAMLAYGLAQKTLPFRNVITFAIFFTTIFNPGLIPTFLTIKAAGIYNTVAALIIPNLVVVWWMLLLRNFFMQIPPEMQEAAFIDGASVFDVLWRIILPLSMPSIATIGMFYAAWHWNSWFDGMIYIMSNNLIPAQVVLRNIISASMIENLDPSTVDAPPPLEAIKSAAIMITTVPILLIYPFVQKYFVKGVMVGGVKG